MTIHLEQLFVLGVISTAVHWLIARSDIARPFWSRTSGWFEKLLRCPACSGFWLGSFITWGGVHPFGDALALGAPWWLWIVKSQLAGLAAMVLTPIFEGVMVWGLRTSALAGEAPQPSINGEIGYVDTTPNPALTESGEVTPNERPSRS